MGKKDVFPQRRMTILCTIADGGGREYGNTVYGQDDLGNRFIFAHLDWFSVKEGDIVPAWETFAEIGDTGYGGAHLHWGMFLPGNDLSELRASNAIDPTNYLMDYGYPCRTIITNPYGSKICNPKLDKHEGIDFSAWRVR